MLKDLALLTVIATVVGCAAMGAQRATPHAPVFDLHVHLWDGDRSLQSYLDQQVKAGIELVRVGAMWFGGPNQAVAGSPTVIAASNDAILALAARDPQVMPIVTVHPYDGAAAVTELERLAGHGVRLLKLHPHTQGFDVQDPRVLALVRFAGELGMIVMLDNANIIPGDSEKLFELALKAPHTKFIFAHAGGMNFRFWNVLKAARTAEGLFGNNIYFDISAVVVLVAGSPVAEEFVWTLRNVGIDRVLLGSDYPQYSLAEAVQALEALPLNDSEKSRILSENAHALFAPMR